MEEVKKKKRKKTRVGTKIKFERVQDRYREKKAERWYDTS